jgi:hypothetical protein
MWKMSGFVEGFRRRELSTGWRCCGAAEAPSTRDVIPACGDARGATFVRAVSLQPRGGSQRVPIETAIVATDRQFLIHHSAIRHAYGMFTTL